MACRLQAETGEKSPVVGNHNHNNRRNVYVHYRCETCRSTTSDRNGNIYVHNIYSGNAWMIMVDEWLDEKTGDKMYNLHNFICDESHLKNCLGLTKGYKNAVEDWSWQELRLSADYKHTPKIVSAIAKARLPITIKLC